MTPSTRRTLQVESFVNRVVEANDRPAKAWVTTDVRDADRDADYVITTLRLRHQNR